MAASGCTAARSHGLRSGGKREAALALRDDVPDYQKGFTAQFTVPRLRESYDAYWYFTQSESDVRADFIAALKQATREYDAVDVFFLAHTNRFIDWVAELPAEQRQKIRLVYDTGCGDEKLANEWLDLGVHSFVGHGDDNIAPVFYVSFLPAWLDGVGADEAVARANKMMEQRLKNPFGRLLWALGGDGRDPRTVIELTRGTHFTRDLTH